MMISGWYQTLLQFVRVYIQLHWGNQHEAEAGIFGEVTIQVLPQVDQPEGWRDGRKWWWSFPLSSSASTVVSNVCFPHSSPPVALATLGCLSDELCSRPFLDLALKPEIWAVLWSSLVGGHHGSLYFPPQWGSHWVRIFDCREQLGVVRLRAVACESFYLPPDVPDAWRHWEQGIDQSVVHGILDPGRRGPFTLFWDSRVALFLFVPRLGRLPGSGDEVLQSL